MCKPFEINYDDFFKTTTRKNVEANIAKSSAARKTSNFKKYAQAEDSTTFYHATTPKYADAIRKGGIDLTKGRYNADFGKGFYMSKSKEVAEWSAKGRLGDAIKVVEFKVPNSELPKLEGLSFNSSSKFWENFVNFHKSYEPQILMHGGKSYDMVSGPMFARFGKNGKAKFFEDFRSQVSIHSEKAVEIFNKGIVK